MTAIILAFLGGAVVGWLLIGVIMSRHLREELEAARRTIRENRIVAQGTTEAAALAASIRNTMNRARDQHKAAIS